MTVLVCKICRVAARTLCVFSLLTAANVCDPALVLGAQKNPPPQGASRPGVLKDTQKALQQFNPKAFGVKEFPRAAARPKEPAVAVSPGRPSASKPSADNEKITFNAERKLPAEGIAPRRAPLPGNSSTLSQFDGPPPPEVAMRYKMRNGTSARMLVNPQDQNSPIYTPAKPGEDVGGAGVYLDMDVDKNLQFQMGGEYRDLDAETGGRSSTDAAGASMGFKLRF